MLDRRPLRQLRLDPRSQLALALAVLAFALAQQLAQSATEYSLAAVLLVVALWAPLVARRTHPITATTAAAAFFVATSGVEHYPPSALGVFVPPVLAYSCGAHAPTRTGLGATVLLIVAIQVNLGFSDFPNAEIALQTLPPWWVGLQLRRRRRIVEELAARTRELEAEEEQFIRLSVHRERARIARDLHDIVSHHVIVMVIQAGAGRLAEPWRAESTAGRFATIRDAGAQALAETDRLVTMLHRDDDGVTPRLAGLLERARDSGANVDVTPANLALPAEIETIAYRLVQEALTNAMKHAPGATVDIRVQRRNDELTITVRNDAVAATSAITDTGSGLGLTGMRDRLATLGGQLDAGPEADSGYCVSARLPLPASR